MQYVAQLRAAHAALGARRGDRAHRPRRRPLSTTYNEPYHVARKFASLDHISGGRAGWNWSPPPSMAEARQFRPRRALWRMTSATSARANSPRSCTACGTAGTTTPSCATRRPGCSSIPRSCTCSTTRAKHFSVRGPLNVPRPPQGYPVIVQAGVSDDGEELAAEFAEAIFSRAARPRRRARPIYDDVKGRCARYGRDPDHLQDPAGPECRRRPHRGRGAREATNSCSR